MMLADPWVVQITMLPVRRTSPDDIRSANPELRQRALKVAERKTENAHAKIADILRHGPASGMTADEIAAPGPASGSLYRHLANMADKGIVQKRRIKKNLVKWSLACR